jgi:hypothetical protein
MSRLLAAAALALVVVTGPAVAEERRAGVGSFEFQAGPYRPSIDSEFPPAPTPGAATPWADSFGSSRPTLYRLHGARTLVSGYGTLELGGGIGYLSASGHGRFGDGTVSQEKTGFMLVPLSLDLTYRLDPAWERLGIPLVPFGRIALIRDQWWVTGAGGATSKSGATNGWSWGGGLALVLDFIDPTLSRELDRDTGIKHTMLVVEVTRNKVDDFGATRNGLKTSWDLSSDRLALSFGFLFAF